MGSVLINWDDRVPVYDGAEFYLRNHFGVSLRVQNALTILEVTKASEYRRVHQEIMALRSQIDATDGGAQSLELHRVPYSSGSLDIVVLWGIVLNGGRRRKARTGDWYFILVHAEEEAAVTRQVFKR